MVRAPHERPDLPRLVPVIAASAAAIVSVVLLWVIAALEQNRPLAIDVWWHDEMLRDRTGVGLVLAWIPGWLAGTLGMITIGLVIMTVLLIVRWWWAALTVAASMLLSVAIAAPLAAVVARIRPSDSLAEAVPTSFPSGHVALAATLGTVAGLLLRRWWVWVIAGLWLVYVAWSRTYLAAHWLTDVIGGAALGVAVALLVWSIVETVRRRRTTTREQ